MEGLPAYALVDSGASCSLVNPRRLHGVNSRYMKPSQYAPIIRSAEGGTVAAEGFYELNVKIGMPRTKGSSSAA